LDVFQISVCGGCQESLGSNDQNLQSQAVDSALSKKIFAERERMKGKKLFVLAN